MPTNRHAWRVLVWMAAEVELPAKRRVPLVKDLSRLSESLAGRGDRTASGAGRG